MEAAKVRGEISEQDYLDQERRASIKSEFFEGEVFAMSGGSRWHSLIAANLVREFGLRLKATSCLVYDSNLRVKIEASNLYTYPDATIACGEQRFADEHEDTLLNPTLLVEVLSDSTEAYDRGRKFEHYRRISSLRGYLLVSQKEPRVELFTRTPNGEWVFQEAAGMNSSLTIPSLNISLELADAFSQVTFVSSPFRQDSASNR